MNVREIGPHAGLIPKIIYSKLFLVFSRILLPSARWKSLWRITMHIKPFELSTWVKSQHRIGYLKSFLGFPILGVTQNLLWIDSLGNKTNGRISLLTFIECLSCSHWIICKLNASQEQSYTSNSEPKKHTRGLNRKK